ncbi:MAG: hypothetical protein ACP5MZ_00220 [Candidatus Micrarchaeia archaeon]
MGQKKPIEKELLKIKEEIQKIADARAHDIEQLKEKSKDEENSSNMLLLLKYMMDENKKTTMLLKNISDNISALTTDAEQGQEVPAEQAYMPGMQQPARYEEIPLSGLDSKIIEYVQVKGMACADDIKALMSYKGRNAASSRLNSLYKRGILQRYQLGHKVYYKYDAGKTTTTLIISPPH